MVDMAPGSGLDSDDDVVLSGLSGRFPESSNIEEFARQLFAGQDLVTVDDRRWTMGMHGMPQHSGKLKDLASFDAAFFGLNPKQAHLMDPQLRILLEVTHEVIVDAGLSPTELRGSRTGVYVGVCNSETEELWTADVDKIDGYALLGCCRAMIANRLSYTFDFKGPSQTIDSACASSMFALVQAANAIRAGHCDAAIVAGTNLCLNPSYALNFHRLRMLSPDGRCASFDESASGYVRSEAVVAVLLQRRRDARRLYCTVRGAGTNNDGHKAQGITYPAGEMQLCLARDILAKAHLRPQDVVYIEAHGTGTTVGDPEEVNAIAELFCKDRQIPLLLGSVKSNMGHAEPASGLCSIAKVVVAIESGVIPGNLHYENPNPNIPALSDGRIKVVSTNTPWQSGLVAVNSFGFGGANAHVILDGGRGARLPPSEYPIPRLVLASGRTDEAVERLLQLAANHPCDAELHALIDAVHAHDISGHPCRGYAVLDTVRGDPTVIEVIQKDSEPRPVWFIFSGMGSQWPRIAQSLLRLPAFATSIARSAAALAPYDVDLHYVITEEPEVDDVINSFASITATQIALVDMLSEIGIRPDGFIGHSLGEIGCAYADETLTSEQAILCAYWRGRSIRDAKLAAGAMAAVGLSWEEAERRCPVDIVPACHNSACSVTVSGPPTSIGKFVAELSAEGVFARCVDSSGVAFHSKYIAAAAPQLRTSLQRVIIEPKPRSARWLSSSIPRTQWDSNRAKLSDAEYYVNNLLSPVRFAPVLALIPERALVLELAPHALLQAVLKRALPNAIHVPLLRRESPDSLVHLLAAVGKVYATGTQPQVSRLYPSVSWPVSRGTPGLASHVSWDHSAKWSVADFRTAGLRGENVIEYDLTMPNDAFIAGHSVDGKIVFSTSGYLVLVWRTLAKIKNMKMEQISMVFENVQFLRVTIVPPDAPLKFFVSLLSGTGQFEISEGGDMVVTGTVRLTDNPASERLPATMLNESKSQDFQEFLPALDSEDIYKELRLRGYKYQGVFRGIKSSDAQGTSGLLNWEGNWMAFMDTVLQFSYIGLGTRERTFVTHLEHVVIDPEEHRVAMNAANCVVVKLCRSLNVIVAGGIEFRGMRTSVSARQLHTQIAPKLEKFEFVPLDCGIEDSGTFKLHAITAALQLVLENCNVLKLNIVEPALQRNVEELLLPYVMQVLEAEPSVRVDATLAAGNEASRYTTAMSSLRVKVSDNNMGGLRSHHLALGVNVLSINTGVSKESDGQCQFESQMEGLAMSAQFVLSEEPVYTLDAHHAAKARLANLGLTVVSRVCATTRTTREYVLLRRANPVPTTKIIIEVRDDDYSWVENLKDAMRRAENEAMRVYVWSCETGSGLLGMGRCLRQECGGDSLRVYYLPGAKDVFDIEVPAYAAQVQLDLAFNVLHGGVWGTFRHLLLDDPAGSQIQVEHAYVDTLKRGDLSSLRWIESDVMQQAKQCPHNELCRVFYASLNFHDVILATGKVPPNLLSGHITDQDRFLGLEFSGHSTSRRRVMGIVTAKGLATTVMADTGFLWDVPEHWSLKEAATVPMAYAMAYYSLVVRGRMRRGESVLVHCGAGGVGQAAIAVALHAGCIVYATVSTLDKRAFLRERFPQLSEANIGNSRDCSFEQLVLLRTQGRGVDIVLNSLVGDRRQASFRCLAEGGRFVEIGKSDLTVPVALTKNITMHSLQLNALFNKSDDYPEKVEIIRCVTEGITSGVVRPLSATIYNYKQLEQAFRYLTAEKHTGKVMISVRQEGGGDLALSQLMPAVPRTYMVAGKSYVVVGGLGGFGLELSDWLVHRGSRTLVLNSRKTVLTGYQAWRIRRWRTAGVRVLVSNADATTPPGARALLSEAATAAPVGGIFNLAVVLRDALLENLTADDFRAVAKPKMEATRALDSASRSLAPELDHFVVFSSVSSGRGNVGQSNYGLANSAMERLCEQRRQDGLPALAVQWGAIGDVGLFATTMLINDIEEMELNGTMPQPVAQCLDTLGALLKLPHPVVSSMVVADKRPRVKPTTDLVHAVARILGIKDSSKVPDTTTLESLGMDSLMGAEIRQTLQRYDAVLAMREIRALTFGRLRTIAAPLLS